LDYKRNNQLEPKAVPDFSLEYVLRARGHEFVAGVDEVGRGPLAGPVTAGAVIFAKGTSEKCTLGIRDSKQLTSTKRELLNDHIQQIALATGLGEATTEEIDAVGIAPATRLAMARAIENLGMQPDALLIDAFPLNDLRLPQLHPKKGDTISLSIAAASIIAKVARDHYMRNMDHEFPNYGFARHKGYGTREHIEALQRFGPCPIHRKTFKPVSTMVTNFQLSQHTI